ncbi:MAG: Gfo/Idh/MocA family oxidoreductase [Kiritimatiellae bacterium]|nr:Gfo/Idh/MocA family oxidoreductase [Kiritimatiellia bacterium]
MNRKLRMGMVGGGPDAFIGEVHRKAARMDGDIELIAGAFSSDAAKSRQAGATLCLDPARVYPSYARMIEEERRLGPDKRIDFVTIVTPNHLHFPIARDFLKAGFHVIVDKPMTLDAREAIELQTIVRETGLVLALTHNYTGYPMVKLARDIVRQDDLGKIRKIVVQYPQGWLSLPLEQEGVKQAQWRTDPKRQGPSGCIQDIGSHAENLAEYITGLQIKEVCADLTSFVEGRQLDDDGNCLVRFEGGAKGILFASQVSVAHENDLAIWVHGEKGSLEWHQENPNYLYEYRIDEPVRTWRRGNGCVAAKSPAAGKATRIPFGHPEGFIEAFANVYLNAAAAIRAHVERKEWDPAEHDYPTVDDGVRGMRFIEAAVESSRQGATWVSV